MDGEWVSEPLEKRRLIERVLALVIRSNAEKPETAGRRMKRRGVVCRISAAGILDMPDDPLQHLSGIDVCAIINRMHLDA